jgi:hypothetical protein
VPTTLERCSTTDTNISRKSFTGCAERKRKDADRWRININLQFCVGRRQRNLDCTEDQHGKYKMARTKLPVEKRPPNTAKSCEVSIKYIHGTKIRPGTTRLPKCFTKIEEGECHLDEAKSPEWMDAEIKTK